MSRRRMRRPQPLPTRCGISAAWWFLSSMETIKPVAYAGAPMMLAAARNASRKRGALIIGSFFVAFMVSDKSNVADWAACFRRPPFGLDTIRTQRGGRRKHGTPQRTYLWSEGLNGKSASSYGGLWDLIHS